MKSALYTFDRQKHFKQESYGEIWDAHEEKGCFEMPKSDVLQDLCMLSGRSGFNNDQMVVTGKAADVLVNDGHTVAEDIDICVNPNYYDMILKWNPEYIETYPPGDIGGAPYIL